ncbi:MAG: RNA polymerase sigma factor [Planctomycetota bacterium]
MTQLEPRIDPDLDLVRACQDPNSDEFEAAFEALYHKYRDRVYSIAYRISGSSADAMDVVQESFSLLFRKIGSFRFNSLFSTWLFRIVVNCSIDNRRQAGSRLHRRAQSLSNVSDPTEPEEEQLPGPEESAEQGELERHVHRSIQRLSDKLRTILVLRYLEGLSYEQLCQALEISIGTVKSRLARAHLALHRVLDGTLGEFGYSEGGKEPPGPPRPSDRGEDQDLSEGVA